MPKQNPNPFDDLPFTRKELEKAAKRGYNRLIEFATSSEFKSLYKNIKLLPKKDRPKFVKKVLLNDDELEKRSVSVPKDILIQRSSFGDRRPTLFCIKYFLPEKFHVLIENVNITFDNPHEEKIPSGKEAWREPLPVELQSAVMEIDDRLQSLPKDIGVSMVDSNPYENVTLKRSRT